jgi:hypothetical protein
MCFLHQQASGAFSWRLAQFSMKCNEAIKSRVEKKARAQRKSKSFMAKNLV